MKRIARALLVAGVGAFAACTASVEGGSDSSRKGQDYFDFVVSPQHLVACTTPPIQSCPPYIYPAGYFVQRDVQECPVVGQTTEGAFVAESRMDILQALWNDFYWTRAGEAPIVNGHFADESTGRDGRVTSGPFRRWLVTVSADLDWFQPLCYYYFEPNPAPSPRYVDWSPPTPASVCDISSLVEVACIPEWLRGGRSGCVGCDGPGGSKPAPPAN